LVVVALLPPDGLLRFGLYPSEKVLDLKGRLRCRGRAVILQARAAAMNDADAIPAPHRRLEIEQDEFVMA
jgi:hypothetical protein